MYLQYGNYQHANNEGSLQVLREGLRAASGILYALRERWHFDGRLQAANTAAVITAQDSLTSNYLVDGLDATFYVDGGASFAHQLLNVDCLGGTRVSVHPSFPSGRGGELSTYRNYTLAIEGDRILPDGLLDWQEMITWSGGGPRFAFLPCLNGPPVKQLVQQQTSFHAVQSGSASGAYSYPAPPQPIWPAAEHIDQRQLVQILPQRCGRHGLQQYMDYRIAWTYTFEDAGQLAGGAPTPWP
jgi:hypothetical protein